jgi:uncharacterized protein YceH (UPF0502 family)
MTDTLEEAKAKLRALGLDPDNPAWVRSGKVNVGDLPSMQKQREAFTQVKSLLEQQVAQDQQQILALREQLARLKRGGGK